MNSSDRQCCLGLKIDFLKKCGKQETITYIKLYELVKKQMLQPTDLIETLAMQITDIICQLYSQVRKVSITITKKYPPVINFSGNVAVCYVKEYQ